MRAASGRRRTAVTTAVVALLAAAAPSVLPQRATAEHTATGAGLYLVTLDGPGTAGTPGEAAEEAGLLASQDDLLDAIGAPEPLYRWTTALNGFAVELDATQADRLGSDPRVALVERNRVVPVAAADSTRATRAVLPGAAGTRPSGAGTVIGFVDTGIAPETPAFRVASRLGPMPERFRGACAEAPDDDRWDAGSCDAKVVGAQFFVEAYGADHLRTAATLSPYDTDGHGTRMATIAAGAADEQVRVAGHRLGRFSGVAPRARVAAYKACWSAPDPDDDGCATADVVAAIDRATADRVDVLNLSIGGPSTIGTVERALLGAVEQGVVVVAAAGNAGERAYAAHPAPWVVSVGATTSGDQVGDVVVRSPRGPRLRGAMALTRPVAGRLVRAADIAAPGVSRDAARRCAPGSLDAAAADGAVVACVRGDGPRVEKSRTVALAGGDGMVLLNSERGSTDADLHALPTVHLAVGEARRLLAWQRRHPATRVRLVAHGDQRRRPGVVAFSSGGDPTSTVLKPDLVAPGSEVVAATGAGWDLVTGTSPAAARVAGIAAVLLGRPGADPASVRSALVTTARPVPGAPLLRAGAGSPLSAAAPDLSYLARPRTFRAWLEGERSDVNLPQVLLGHGRKRARRTLTNTSTHTVLATARLEGFAGAVSMRPQWARLRPGASVTFRITATGSRARTDDGFVVWSSDAHGTVRIPVVVTR